MKRALLVLALASVGLAGCAPTPPPAPVATIDPYALKVGDCVRDGNFAGTVARITRVDCSRVHDAEAFATTRLKGDAFPGAAAVHDAAQKFCVARFAEFAGIDYNDSKLLDVSWYFPTEASWTQRNDREVMCTILELDAAGNPTTSTASLRGADR